MAGEWVEKELRDIAAKTDRAFAMGPFGSNIKAENYRDTGVPVIRGINLGAVGDASFIAKDFVFLDEAKADELASSNCAPNDIIFVAQGTVGKVGIIPPDTPYTRFVLSQNLMKVTVDSERADPQFVFYFYRSSLGQQEILSRVNPTGVPCISKPLTSLRQFGIRLPVDVNEQRAIAYILGTLDDKIELNRRMNETLEAMARALFKSWFVDFDPVRAKAEGRDPGLPQQIADLFPDSFENSELGEIPKGWEVKAIGDLADVVGGTTPSTKEPTYWEGGTHAWATPKDLSALSIPILLDTERRITDAGLSQVGSGLLPKGTVLLSSRAPIGYLAIAEIPVAINQGFIAMTPKAGTSNLFLLLWASVAHEEIVSRANGSTFLEISKTNFRPIPVVKPPVGVMRKFDELARPVYTRIVESACESCKLAVMRDTLLPKLISGELPVINTEKFIESRVT